MSTALSVATPLAHPTSERDFTPSEGLHTQASAGKLAVNVAVSSAPEGVSSPMRRAGIALSWLMTVLQRVRGLRSKLDGHRASVDGSDAAVLLPLVQNSPNPVGTPRQSLKFAQPSPPAGGYSLTAPRPNSKSGSRPNLVVPASPETQKNPSRHIPVRSSFQAQRSDSGGASSLVVASAGDSLFPGPSVVGVLKSSPSHSNPSTPASPEGPYNR